MNLRKKTLLILSVTLSFLIIVFYLISSRIILDSFKDVEDAEITRNVQRASDTINDDIISIENVTRDWASWDDTYTFIDGSNEEYLSSNLDLDASWVNNKLNLMMFVNNSGDAVFSRAFDLNDKSFMPVPEEIQQQFSADSALLRDLGSEVTTKGILMLPAGPMLFAALPILTSDGAGPARGTLIFGRFLDAAQMEHLSRVTHLSLTLQDTNAAEMPADFAGAASTLSADSPIAIAEFGDETIAGYSEFTDVYGKPAFLLRVDSPRDIYAEGQNSIRYLIISLVITGLIIGLVIILLLERMVVSRMARLSDDVTKIGETDDYGARLNMDGKDEISNLADVINQMVSGLQQAQLALKQVNVELESRVQRRTADLNDKVAVLETLAEIDREVIGATLSRPFVDLVCQRAAKLLRVPKTMVTLSDTNGNGHDARHVAACFGFLNPCYVDQNFIDTMYTDSDFMVLIDQKNIVALDVIAPDHPCLSDLLKSEKVESLIAVPLKTNDNVIGELIAFDTKPHEWSADELQVMSLLSGQMAVALDKLSIFEEEQNRREELASLYDLSRKLADASPEGNELLELVTRHAVDTIHVTFARIALLDNNELVMSAAHPVRILNQDLRVGCREDAAAHPFLLETMGKNMPVVVSWDDPRLSDCERENLFLDLAKSVCLVPLRTGIQAHGLLMLGESREVTREPFSKEKIRLARSIGDQTASAIWRAELFDELEHAYLQTVTALANAVDAKDSYTADHGLRLAEAAMAIGSEMGLSARELEELRFGAILHDVGKIGIPDSVLQKPAKLTSTEWQKMVRHPAIGQEILDPLPRFTGTAQIVRSHHERYEGNGYPDKLSGKDIPLGARILNVVDSFSAMIDKRVYKEPMAHDDAVAELKRSSGSQFDPEVVDIFLRLMKSGNILAA